VSAFVVVLSVVVAVVGWLGLVGQDHDAASIAARASARSFLAAAALDVAQSQVLLGSIDAGDVSGSDLAVELPQALSQQQLGVDKWNQFQTLVSRWGRLPPVSFSSPLT
jgi:hypothetical protein